MLSVFSTVKSLCGDRRSESAAISFKVYTSSAGAAERKP